MKVPFNWLKLFTPVPVGPQELADRLTMRGLEVEGLEQITPSFTEVYVGEILEVEKSPEADKLSLCRVTIGKDVLPIVCGAPNVSRGKKVPVAVAGARLSDNILIEKRRIRGMESEGMLCSEKELALSDDHTGIMILPDSCATGTPLDVALGITDHVLDVNVPPNRGDCQSILGIAREAASIFDQTVTLPDARFTEGEAIDGYIELSVLDTDACPRYILRIIKDIAIVPSPFWMRNRITRCGMRPINSIVDVTNYVMLELGQPLHAFDYERIAERRIEVRLAHEGLMFRTLDGSDRRLQKGDVLICDGSGPVALAGVMGGENSEISPGTKHVALESAFFNPLLIRQTARRLDLRSEASARFEKGIDIATVDYTGKRAIGLMQEISGGTVLRGLKEVYEKKPPKSISLSLKRTNDVIGKEIGRGEALKALASIGLGPQREDDDRVVCSIPSFRHDLNEYFDLIEEVARIVGYDNIEATAPVGALLPVRRSKRDLFIDSAKTYFTAAGFFEVINYAFFDKMDVERFNIPVLEDEEQSDERAACVPVLNPISKELGVMRTFLAAGVLESMAYNLNRGTKNLRVFEMGKVFFQAPDLPREAVHLCCAMAGKEREYFWRDQPREFDFFDLKGVLEAMVDQFGLSLRVEYSKEPFLNAGKSADLFIADTRIGWMGELSRTVTEAYEIKEKVLCAEIDFDMLTHTGTSDRTYQPIPRYPAVTRDFSFFVDESISVSTLIETIKQASPLIVSVGVFDMFKKEEVRSISFRVVFQSFEDTLTDEAINSVQQSIISRLTKTEGIKLRT